MTAQSERDRLLREGYRGTVPIVRTLGSDDLAIRDKRLEDDPTLDADQGVFANTAVTQANPAVITITAHGFADEQGPFRLELISGTIPTGFAVATDYYIVYVNANTFQISTTKGGSGVACTDNSNAASVRIRSTGQRAQRDAGNAGGDAKVGHYFPIASTETDDIYA